MVVKNSFISLIQEHSSANPPTLRKGFQPERLTIQFQRKNLSKQPNTHIYYLILTKQHYSIAHDVSLLLYTKLLSYPHNKSMCPFYSIPNLFLIPMIKPWTLCGSSREDDTLSFSMHLLVQAINLGHSASMLKLPKVSYA